MMSLHLYKILYSIYHTINCVGSLVYFIYWLICWFFLSLSLNNKQLLIVVLILVYPFHAIDIYTTQRNS